MTNPPRALSERLGFESAPSVELDAAFAALLPGGGRLVEEPGYDRPLLWDAGPWRKAPLPEFTRSMDAARQAFHLLFPGWDIEISSGVWSEARKAEIPGWFVRIESQEAGIEAYGSHVSEPAAAMVRAMSGALAARIETAGAAP